MIGRSGERGSEISVLAARHDDNVTMWERKCIIALICQWYSPDILHRQAKIEISVRINLCEQTVFVQFKIT